MKKFLNAVFLMLLLNTPRYAFAQLNHFIYLQTEGRQPFYAKLDKQVFSSSASGYLILPKLQEGPHTIVIGFPKNEAAEQRFVCTIGSKDEGYLVKNFGDKGWGLFNLQTMNVVMAGDATGGKDVAVVEKTDEFSNLLSTVVNDPSIRQEKQPVAKTKEETAPAVSHEANPAVPDTVKQVEVAMSPVAKEMAKPAIEKTDTKEDEQGLSITYLDHSGSEADTINIYIPAEDTTAVTTQRNAEPVAAGNIEQPAAEKELSKDSAEIKKAPEEKEQVVEAVNQPAVIQETIAKPDSAQATVAEQFLPIEVKAGETTVVETPQSKEVKPMINSDCKNYATDDDFLKLRKKMAGADNDDDMLETARKYFKSKCYTVDQVKNLSVLFLKDEGKYHFFDLAYGFVSDSHNFPVLESQLTEEYYISRFKAMIRH